MLRLPILTGVVRVMVWFEAIAVWMSVPIPGWFGNKDVLSQLAPVFQLCGDATTVLFQTAGRIATDSGEFVVTPGVPGTAETT